MKANIRLQLIILLTLVLNLPLSAQTTHSVRNIARDASTEIDAVYTNPAGLIKLPAGTHISINNQSIFQKDEIQSDYMPFSATGESNKNFTSKANSIIIPNVLAAYKKDKWIISAGLGVSNYDKMKFTKGISTFEAPIASLPIMLTNAGIETNKYSMNSNMEKTALIYNFQLGVSYSFSKIFSAYGGLRSNLVNNEYKGSVTDIQLNPLHPILNPGAQMIPAYDFFNTIGQSDIARSLKDSKIDVAQKGFGLSPIIGININHEKLNIGIKYEFKTKIEIENSTKVDNTGMYTDGVKTPNDIPALFSIGLSYQLSPELLASIGYHYIFENNARKSDNKQQYIKNTNEFQAGLEYEVDKKLLLSAGGQYRQPKAEDNYQTDLDYILKSYSIGFGAAYDFTDKLRLNIGYQWTNYSDYTKITENCNNTGLIKTDTFSKGKSILAIGLDYHF
ncbi:MAG: TonB-dependent receptor [Prevotella sp.]|jgi:long-chain fatty acid transport protein|nr:TonB-dependent receptor [Prevotella sp.]